VKLTSILAIYVLFWTLCLFLVMPWHVRTAEEVGEKVELGHAESAPHRFPAAKIAVRTTLLWLDHRRGHRLDALTDVMPAEAGICRRYSCAP